MRKKITLKKNALLFFIPAVMLVNMSTQAVAQCTANFTWVQTSNNIITFTNTSTGTGVNTSYHWNFGDAGYSYTQNPMHTYNIPGTYTACLLISDSGSFCNSTVCYQVIVTGVIICNLTATAQQINAASCGTCADGSASANVAGGTAPYSYSWNTAPVQTTSYASGLLPGVYTVCITDVNSCTACATVTIDTSACNADFTWTQTLNNTITFTNTSNGGSSASYHWFFGDGTHSYNVNPVHYYSMPGTYTVCLNRYDSLCTDSVCKTITVTGVPCNLTVTASATNASCGVCTDGTASATVSGGSTPYSFLWNTGATTQNISGLSPGTYSVCVTDSNGCNQCDYVTVGPFSPGCNAYFTIYPDSILPHTYWGINQSSGSGQISYMWSWGDGTIDTIAYPTHTYAAAGYYTICLVIVDSGCSSTYCDSMYLNRLSNSMVTVNIIPPNSTGIKDNAIINTLTLFPNPAKDYVVVGNVSSKEKLISATLFNSKGSLVAKKIMKNNTFDVRDIPGGIYFAKFLHPGGNYSSARLVIVR